MLGMRPHPLHRHAVRSWVEAWAEKASKLKNETQEAQAGARKNFEAGCPQIILLSLTLKKYLTPVTEQ